MHKLWLPVLVAASLGVGCERPAQETAAPPAAPSTPPPEAQASQPASVVPIPEEFQTTATPPAPAAPVAVTPRILFAVTDIQVTTKSGIQGIMAGETVNVIREVGDEIVVQYGDLEFIKPKSLFSAIFVGGKPQTTPEAEPVAEPVSEPVAENSMAAPAPAENLAAPSEQPPAAEPVDTIGLAAPVPATPLPVAEPILPDEPAPSIARNPPQLSPEEKKMAELTTSIRVLNDKIRVAQEQASASGKKPTRNEKRAIDQMKSERDELSQRLTSLGKP